VQREQVDARIAVHTSWAKTTDRKARTAAGRAAFLDRFEREVDPDGTLAPEERARRAENARRAYFYALALRSAQARRKRRHPPHRVGTSNGDRASPPPE
jgi:hypothetical protein